MVKLAEQYHPEMPSEKQWRGVLDMDITRAYLKVPATRTMYVILPPEIDPNNMFCAKLEMTSEGCHNEGFNWGEHLAMTLETLKQAPFTRGKVKPGSFYQRETDVAGLVHFDDGLFCGPRWAWHRLKTQMQEEFDIKVKMIGPFTDEGDCQECNVLKTAVSDTPRRMGVGS